MLEEKFSTSELVQNIQGHVTAELFDAKTGKLVQREQTHNFVSQSAIDFLKQSQRTQFTRGIYTLNNSLNQDYFIMDKSDGVIVLTDNTTASDPATETHMYGQFLGWANKDNYSGSDIYRGTVNGALCSADATQCTWVFDWPTSAANGTIGSVGWVKPAGFCTDTSLLPAPFYPSWSSVINTYATTQTWTYFTRASSSQSFSSTGSTTISVLDSTFSPSNSFSVSAQFSAVKGIAWDNANNKLWVLGTSSSVPQIASYTTTGTLVDALTTVANHAYTALAFDGTTLWSLSQSSNTVTVYAINPTDGSEVSNFAYQTAAYNSGSGDILYDYATGIAWEATTATLWIRHYTYHYSYGTDTVPFSYGILSSSTKKNTPSVLRGFKSSGQSASTQIALCPVSQQLGTKNAAVSAAPEEYSVPYSDIAYENSYYVYAYTVDCSARQDFDIIDQYNFAIPADNAIYQITADGMGSRALLSTAIAKTSTETLRITYQMIFN